VVARHFLQSIIPSDLMHAGSSELHNLVDIESSTLSRCPFTANSSLKYDPSKEIQIWIPKACIVVQLTVLISNILQIQANLPL
jgi:hypothetical protein